jgi:hypothetical protein
MKSAVAVNFASPDNSSNCAEPNLTDAVQPSLPKPPKKPRTLIVITAIHTTGLLIKIGLETDGGSIQGSSARHVDIEEINPCKANRQLVGFL